MNTFSHVPPGFRFHPTDEELVDYYLRKKINSRRIDLDVIKDVDLYKIEPWDLIELCRLGTEDQNEWYFFSHKDKKYPTGTRTNRATTAGFWKATGRDKAIYSKHDLVGMRKTLVFYKGRAPNGQKSDWIMHEYRLETDENATTQEEGWVVCRVFKKRVATMRKVNEHESPIWYGDHNQVVSFMPEMNSSPIQNSHSYTNLANYHHYPYDNSCKKELEDQFHHNYQIPSDHFLHLPLLESPKMPPSTCNNSMPIYGTLNINHGTAAFQSSSITQDQQNFNEQAVDQVTDWRVLDKFVASQLSQGDNVDVSKENCDYSNAENLFQGDDQSNLLSQGDVSKEDASTSISSCQIDMWK